MKLFDCHNHIHLGPRGLAPLLESIPEALQPSVARTSVNEFSFAGAAIMSTHPRDYPEVDSIVSELKMRNFRAVPCFGIHPWFLHEYLLETNSTKSSNGYISANKDYVCEEEWYKELKKRLQSQPDAIVGEIGLDGARWVEVDDDENDDTETTQAAMLDSQETNNNKYIKDKSKESIWNRKRVLACPMDLQRKAFENQLYLATELQRPVSIHVVRAWGELFDSFDTVRERMKQKYIVDDAQYSHDETIEQLSNREKPPKRLLLPPKIYFHAFSGKEGVLPSLLSACAKGNIDPVDDVYFGFPPAIPNFYAPKTPSIMRKIGINQLLIETDLEDASCAWGDLITGAEFIANALDLDVAEVASRTYANAENFYFGSAK